MGKESIKKLPKRQVLFVKEYLIDLNATQAAIRAGYSKATAAEQASRLLSNVKIQAEIKKAMDKRAQRTEITQDRVLKEYARLAFFDPRKFFDENGDIKAITNLDDDTAACVAGMDVLTKYTKDKDGDVGPETIKKIKLADKKGALDSVARHLGMFEKDNDQQKANVVLNLNLTGKN